MSTLALRSQSTLSPSNNNLSGISSSRYKLVGKALAVPNLDPRKVAKIHFDELQIFLGQHFAEEPLNYRSNAREKLSRIAKQAFQELSTDVYDEVVRRKDNAVLFLPVQDNLHPKRNQARQKLATLPEARFKDLAGDVLFELGRQYPEFKEPEVSISIERSKAPLARLVQIPLESSASPASNYDDMSSPDFRDARPLPPASSYSLGPNARHKPSREHTSFFPVMPVDRLQLSREQNNEYNSATEQRQPPTVRATPGRRPSDEFATTSGPPRQGQGSELVPHSRLLGPPSDLNSDVPAFSSSLRLQSDTNLDAQAPAGKTIYYKRSLEPFSRNSPLCLDGKISHRSEYVVASGGYADVWTGFLGTKIVAIKVVRPFSGSGAHIEISKIFRRSWREYLTWSRLSHPNILECLGFSYDFSPQTGQPSLVSPWMSNGTVMEYIKKRSKVNRLEIVIGIARGLTYLHNMRPTIVHGDLRAGNVLVSDRGTACLADFGLSKVLSDVRGMTTSSELAGSLRWMAPELLRGSALSVKSDIWAYGMTVLEILTGTRPYSEIAFDVLILEQISKAVLPTRPNDVYLVTDEVWTLCQKCWQFLPAERPSIDDILVEMEGEVKI